MIIAGIDPGSHTTGYAFIEKTPTRTKVLEFGIVKAKKEDDLFYRVGYIVQELRKLFSIYKPELLSMETTFYAKNVKSAMILSHVRGAIMQMAYSHNARFCEYSPREIKQAVAGTGKASKDQVAFMLQRLLGLKELPQPLDASDALAVAVTSLYQKVLP